jgi:hypothetical protein
MRPNENVLWSLPWLKHLMHEHISLKRITETIITRFIFYKCVCYITGHLQQEQKIEAGTDFPMFTEAFLAIF